MRYVIVLLVVTLAGCAVNDARLKLAGGVWAGLDLCDQAIRDRDDLLASAQDSQRRRLDQAFDADVRQQTLLSADWVIEHRRIYSSALDALADQRDELARRSAADEANIAATRAAVERIKQFAAMQRSWWGWIGKE